MAAALAHRDAVPSRPDRSADSAPVLAWGAAAWEAAPSGPLVVPGEVEDGHLADVIPLRPRTGARTATPRRMRRRTAALLGLLVVAVVATVVAVRGITAPPPTAPGAAAAATVTLAPGDTLWDIAVDVTPRGGDPRATLAEIREVNGFDGQPVPAWTVVRLPAAG